MTDRANYECPTRYPSAVPSASGLISLFFFFFFGGGPFRQLFQCETTLPTSINIHIVKVKLHRWLPQIHTLYQHIITSSVGLANCCRHMILSISTRKRKRGSPMLSLVNKGSYFTSTQYQPRQTSLHSARARVCVCVCVCCGVVKGQSVNICF